MLSVGSGSPYPLLPPKSPNNGLHPMAAFGVYGWRQSLADWRTAICYPN
jgi:hypothetical protein